MSLSTSFRSRACSVRSPAPASGGCPASATTGTGYPEYGLRYFTIQPGGQIPIHNHFYHQTMYILSGKFECYQYDLETEETVETCTTAAGDFVYVPSMEPHGMKNIGTEPATFLCCIANVYEEK
jgi:quercetin dioxygenase-like cupin family protein